MLSNSDRKDKFFEHLYHGYYINKINANRMINCQGDKRGKFKKSLLQTMRFKKKNLA
jgi:DNA adenine methylase